MMKRTCTVGVHTIGPGSPLAVIAGPCTLESKELGLRVGEHVRDACAHLGLPYVFKASFDKANRSRLSGQRGPGIERGLDELAEIRETLGVPVTTDVHLPEQCAAAAEAVDILQIPAFLSRQTDLLVAAGEAAAAKGRAVNVKKGQFLAPAEMVGAVSKVADSGCHDLIVTDRGTFFGYHRLVTDFIGLGDLMDPPADWGVEAMPPVCYDVTHSAQLPGLGSSSGGRADRAPLLARSAVAAGVHAVFIETHPEPSKAWSDGATMIPLEEMQGVLASLAAIRGAMESAPV
jgi:2-dehydro-3-deoxyphosphooctonate aldolase (KDO 8-P synthase)